MGQEVLVDDRFEEGRRLLSQLARDGFEFSVAFWTRSSEEGLWHLYIASPSIRPETVGHAYGTVYLSLSKVGGPWITLSDIRLISPDNPIARDALEVRRRFPGHAPIRTEVPRLGDLSIGEAYIYPPVVRPKCASSNGTQVRLKRDVEQKARPEDVKEPLSPEESQALAHIISCGVLPAEAECYVWKRREADRRRRPIPAGTVVRASVAGWWGADPADDPNPLLLVEAEDGAQGLTFKENTEPV